MKLKLYLGYNLLISYIVFQFPTTKDHKNTEQLNYSFPRPMHLYQQGGVQKLKIPLTLSKRCNLTFKFLVNTLKMRSTMCTLNQKSMSENLRLQNLRNRLLTMVFSWCCQFSGSICLNSMIRWRWLFSTFTILWMEIDGEFCNSRFIG